MLLKLVCLWFCWDSSEEICIMVN